MSDYPKPLYDLVARHFEGNMQALVEMSGGKWAYVQQSAKPFEAIHYGLKYLCGMPELLVALRSTIDEANYMTDEVARAIDDHLASIIAPWCAPPVAAELGDLDGIASTLTGLYPDSESMLGLARRAGLADEALEGAWVYAGDPVATWRSLLLVAALQRRFQAIVERADVEHKENQALSSIAFKLRNAQDRQFGLDSRAARAKSDLQDRQPGQETRERSDAPIRRAVGSSNPPSGTTSARPRDLSGSVRLAVQRSALQALDRLHGLMDSALAEFASEDARGAVPSVETAESVTDYLDAVNGLRDDIDALLLAPEPDEAPLLDGLETLIATVLAGIRAAELDSQHDAVAELAEQAADAYEAVAPRLTADAGVVLGRVVPYWRMKAAHARHEDKVNEQKGRLAPATASNRASNARRPEPMRPHDFERQS